MLDSQDDEGKSGLFWAIVHQKEEAANLLINNGCKVDTVTNEKNGQCEGDTPLMHASYLRMDDLVRKLVENGAVIGRPRKDKGNAVFSAAQQGHLTTLKFLLENKASLADQTSWVGRTPLLGAAKNGHLQVVKYMLTTHKVNINSQDDEKNTALILAAIFNQPLVVEYLLQQGADSSITGIGNKTALEKSVEKKHDRVTDILQKFNKK